MALHNPDEIRYYDSDHTALVHVLWSAQHDGLIPKDTKCDDLAQKIMTSRWFMAVKLHAAEAKLRELDPGAFKC